MISTRTIYTNSKVLTTGQAARFADVASRTVQTWCSRDMLDWWFVPGSRHRRITAVSLLRLLESSNAPVPEELRDLCRPK